MTVFVDKYDMNNLVAQTMQLLSDFYKYLLHED